MPGFSDKQGPAGRSGGNGGAPEARKLAEQKWKPRPAGPLSGKQRGYLKRLAHSLKPTVQIGQDGVTDRVVGEIRRQLLLHELIKVKWSGILEEEGSKKDRARELAERAGAHFVTLIGQNVVMYRAAPREDALPQGRQPIRLPR